MHLRNIGSQKSARHGTGDKQSALDKHLALRDVVARSRRAVHASPARLTLDAMSIVMFGMIDGESAGRRPCLSTPFKEQKQHLDSWSETNKGGISLMRVRHCAEWRIVAEKLWFVELEGSVPEI